MKLLTSFLFLSLPIFLAATNYSIGDKLNVVAINGLFLRSQPNTEGDKLRLLKTGEKVMILNTFDFKENQDSIFGFKGNWVEVQTSNKLVGFVFDAFLSTLPIAKSLTKIGRKVPDNPFELGEELPNLLEKYVEQIFSKSGCSFAYGNRSDGESSHGMSFHKLVEGHTLINHQWYEGMSSELILENVRVSEVYYLIHQFFEDTSLEVFEINDYELRNPKVLKNCRRCVGNLNGNGCGVFLYKNSQSSYSIEFNFPCC